MATYHCSDNKDFGTGCSKFEQSGCFKFKYDETCSNYKDFGNGCYEFKDVGRGTREDVA